MFGIVFVVHLRSLFLFGDMEKVGLKKSFERLQKVAALALCVVMAGSFYSCGKRAEPNGEAFGGDVQFWLCQCGASTPDTIHVKGEAYLFFDSIPDAKKTKLLQEYSSSDKNPAWIVYGVANDCNHEVDSLAILHVYDSIKEHRSYICNFPDFAKRSKVYLTGQKVYYEGKALYLGGYACVTCTSFYYLGLTILKTK